MKPSDYIEKGWTQGTYAIDELGNDVGTTGKGVAVAWCAMGAIHEAYKSDREKVTEVFDRLSFELLQESPSWRLHFRLE